MIRALGLLLLFDALSPCIAQIPPGSDQLLVVTTPGWTDIAGSAQRYERHGRQFRKVGAPFAIVVGRSGLGWDEHLHVESATAAPFKHEGDGRAPAGIFPLGTAFGYESSLSTHLSYLPLTATIECVDDPRSAHYNQLVDGHVVARDWDSSEQMRRNDELYHYGVVVNYNQPSVAGAGSCIFLHVWRNVESGTDGCTAMEPDNILMLLHWLDPKRNPLLVQMPLPQYQQLRSRWELPVR